MDFYERVEELKQKVLERKLTSLADYREVIRLQRHILNFSLIICEMIVNIYEELSKASKERKGNSSC